LPLDRIGTISAPTLIEHRPRHRVRETISHFCLCGIAMYLQSIWMMIKGLTSIRRAGSARSIGGLPAFNVAVLAWLSGEIPLFTYKKGLLSRCVC